MVIIRREIPAQIAPARRSEWHRTLAAHLGIVTIDELNWFGVPRDAITANLEAGRWQRVAPRVYATYTGQLTEDARRLAALSYAGPDAVLSHQTAGSIWGMCPDPGGPVHVTVPYGRSAVSQPALVTVHRSRAFAHISVASSPPMTSRADTAVDLAVAERTAREAMRTLTAVVTARRASAAQVRARMEERPPRRYRRALLSALERIDTGVHSALEELYAVDVEAAHGLPQARRQVPFPVDGKVLVEDAVYDHLGIPLTVRLDGSTHLLPEVAYRDRRRGNVAEVSGRSRLVFGWPELSKQPCKAAVEVAQVLWRLGWMGELRSCGARECAVVL